MWWNMLNTIVEFIKKTSSSKCVKHSSVRIIISCLGKLISWKVKGDVNERLIAKQEIASE